MVSPFSIFSYVFTLKFNLWFSTLILTIYLIICIQYDFYNDDTENLSFELRYNNPLDIDFQKRCGVYGCLDENIDFEGFNNEQNDNEIIVPNLVHLLYLRKSTLTFMDMICLYSIYLNHRPTIIYIHCDECKFEDKYWNEIKMRKNLWNLIMVNKIPKKTRIFGKETNNMELISGITRLLVLMNYGGIYLDTTMYVVNSLNNYRKFEHTVSLHKFERKISPQITIAHKNSRFLRAHFDTYRYNLTDEANFNLVILPSTILKKHKKLKLVHKVKVKFGTNNLTNKLYETKWMDWKTELDTVDLSGGMNLINENTLTSFSDKTIGLMVNDILERIKHL